MADDQPRKKPGPKPPPPLNIETDDPLGAFDKLLGADPDKAKSEAQRPRRTGSGDAICPLCDEGTLGMLTEGTGIPIPIIVHDDRSLTPTPVKAYDPERHHERSRLACDSCGKRFRWLELLA